MRALSLAASFLFIPIPGCDDDVKTYRIPSSAMEPTLRCGPPGSGCTGEEHDVVRVKVGQQPKRGDIVVFETPLRVFTACGAEGTFVKRLVGLPGETVSVRRGVVFINDTRLLEPYLRPERRDRHTDPPRKIPPNHYFFLGDNRTRSCDSRVWGTVPADDVIGVVFEIRRGDRKIPVP